jgi:hypothetical protein
MELDGYNRKLKMAFEHQGEQHYSTISHYKTTSSRLARRKKDDRRKYYLTRKNGVHLFCIPQVPHRISPENLIPYIAHRAQHRGILVPRGWEKLEIDFLRVYHGHAKERLKYCHSLAARKGGKFLSTVWRGEEFKYTWRCSKGHEWKTLVRRIKKGNWCKTCAGMVKHTIEEFQQIAKNRGFECLSKRYVSNREKLKFRCKEGHIFYCSGDNLKNKGRGCPECSGKKKHTLKQMQDIARARKGKCLSIHYTNNKTKLLWQCEKGHQWEATPHKIIQGHWCIHSTCRGERIWATRRASARTGD